MKICVVTPYYNADPDWLRQAHESVRQQTVPAHHILVCDGGARIDIPGFQGTHITLKRNYRDYGNTPRLIGCYNAITQGADAIAFLDADNWYQQAHLEGMTNFARENQLDACASSRLLHRLDGSFMMKCPIVNGQPYIDTSALMVTQSGFHHMLAWVLPGQEVAALTNQTVWAQMGAAGARLGFLSRPTVCYRTRHATHYVQAGEEPPPMAFDRIDVHGQNYQAARPEVTQTAPA